MTKTSLVISIISENKVYYAKCEITKQNSGGENKLLISIKVENAEKCTGNLMKNFEHRYVSEWRIQSQASKGLRPSEWKACTLWDRKWLQKVTNGTNFVNACIHSIPGSEWKFLITCPGEKSFIIVGRLSGPKLGEKAKKWEN